MVSELIDSGAEFSPCRTWRYRLWRRWAEGPCLMVIGLNPSTADEERNDPTVTRCIGFARRWGFGGLRMSNIFAFRATDPRELGRAANPIGPETDVKVLADAHATISEDGAIVAAWGNHGIFLGRGLAVSELLREHVGDIGVACLGLNLDLRVPRHPLYLPATTVPVPFLGDGGRLCRQSVVS